MVITYVQGYQYETFIIILEPVANPHRDNISKFIIETPKQSHTMKVNNFDKWYKIYAELITSKIKSKPIKNND